MLGGLIAAILCYVALECYLAEHYVLAILAFGCAGGTVWGLA